MHKVLHSAVSRSTPRKLAYESKVYNVAETPNNMS
jgi:hypothetical protein